MPSKAHTDREYEAELRRVRDSLLKMSGRVEQMISDSVKALLEGNAALAKQTIDEDHKVNRIEVDTDDLCLLILAKRQPMASDLRFITLAMKMVTDMERIGDLAVNISERTIALRGFRPDEFATPLGRMSSIDQTLLRDATDAFALQDADKAQKVCQLDDEVDALYWQIVNEVQARMSSDLAYVERGIHVQAAAKFLERIGDHITNLAELVVFMVKGKDIRHLGKREDI